MPHKRIDDDLLCQITIFFFIIYFKLLPLLENLCSWVGVIPKCEWTRELRHNLNNCVIINIQFLKNEQVRFVERYF